MCASGRQQLRACPCELYHLSRVQQRIQPRVYHVPHPRQWYVFYKQEKTIWNPYFYLNLNVLCLGNVSVLQILAAHHEAEWNARHLTYDGVPLVSHDILQPLHKFAVNMFLISPAGNAPFPARHEQEKPCPITKELWQPELPIFLMPHHFPSLNNVSIAFAFTETHWKWWLELIDSHPHWTHFLSSGQQEYMFIKRPVINELMETLGAKLLSAHGKGYVFFFFFSSGI